MFSILALALTLALLVSHRIECGIGSGSNFIFACLFSYFTRFVCVFFLPFLNTTNMNGVKIVSMACDCSNSNSNVGDKEFLEKIEMKSYWLCSTRILL